MITADAALRGVTSKSEMADGAYPRPRSLIAGWAAQL
jgi:hypothetical protein